MPSGVLQLAAYGAQDIYLSGNPQITFFEAVYRRHTPFCMENVTQYFTGEADFGKKVYCKIDRIGDLLNKLYLHVQLPSLQPYAYTDSTGNPVSYYWVNGVGNVMIKYVEIQIGEVVVDRQYGMWMDIWSELSVDPGKKLGYYDCIGKTDTPINLNNDAALNLYVPLQFWFCKNIGMSLPIVALQSAEVRINIVFRDARELIISSTGDTMSDADLATIHMGNASLLCDFIYLEEDERRKFAEESHEYLVEQIQINSTSLPSNGPIPGGDGRIRPITDQIVDLDFYNPVKEIIWVIQNSSALSVYPYGGNEFTNYSTQPYKKGTVNGTDPLLQAKFMIEGNDLTDYKDYKYYRVVIPLQYHSNIPNNFIYSYSFALRPEAWQPSGTLNMSYIDSFQLRLVISDQLIDPIVTVYAVSYNILRITDGLAGVEYS